MPVAVTRRAFTKMAMGIQESIKIVLCQKDFLMKYANTVPRASKEIRDRIPLQASATASVVSASLIIFPSRKTGISSIERETVATFDAKSCMGKVIFPIRIDGMGIMNIKNAMGKSRILK